MAEGTRSQDVRKMEEHVRAMLREQQDQFEKEMAALRNLVIELHTQKTQAEVNDSAHTSDTHLNNGGGYQIPSRLSRVDFPRFNGVDFRGWLYKSEQFFEVDETPSYVKVKIAAMNLEGKALQWHQIFMKSRLTREAPLWEEYVKELSSRFGDSLYDDPMGELKSLKQTGSVQEYHDLFEELLNRVDLPEDYATSCFISGLKPDIQLSVRMFMPKNICHARILARMEEAKGVTQQKGKMPPRFSMSYQDHASTSQGHASIPGNKWKADPRPLLPSPQVPTFPALPSNERQKDVVHKRPFRRLSRAEMDEKRARGLCFWCDDRFVAGHRCGNKQFHRLEVWDELVEDEGNESVEEDDTLDEGQLAHISLNAMTSMSVPNFRTMRVTGHVGKQNVNIFIDCGSSHNFIHPRVVQKLGVKTVKVEPLVVEVADGNKLTTQDLCPGFTWKMQGQEFKADLLVLPVGGCELVLGMQWLTTLGDVKWNFQELRMEFIRHEHKVVLRGMKQQELQLVKRKKMQKILQKPEQIVTAQLSLIKAVPNTSEPPSLYAIAAEPGGDQVSSSVELEQLLNDYDDVFQEPSGLPPERLHDHKILLKNGTEPVNVRPYRYPTFQKGEIEKLVAEMLACGIIRPSSSPFSSPVVLVKKKDGSWRMCVDYRQLNSATVKNKFPIPLIEELLDELFGAKFFTKLDLRSGYHQIRMKAEDVEKTAFRTHDGHYEFLVMPFGLTNAPSTFQNLMNDIFRPFLRKFILVFFDDILIYSCKWKEHLQHLGTVFKLLRNNSLKVKRSKCTFAQQQVDYLGHVINAEGVQADPKKSQPS
ncbi:uncharacterized protein [Coffea arabica]|uniref:Reverse transcriptase domain-containing protein n=1 Tax=Coffea arabica TaxID=13443 RepID=A0ABM4UEJ9_COFAR